MFLTVTPNASLDRILFIDRFEPRTTMRTHKRVDAVGGKGFDTSVALRCLGQETVAVGFQAGAVGAALADLVRAYGIQLDLVEVPGETRISHIIIEEALHRHSHIITSGHSVTPEEFQALLERIEFHLPAAAWMAVSGSLPGGMGPDSFRTFVLLAHEHNVPMLMDTSGLPVLEALSARPDIVKMNDQEFRTTFNESAASMNELAASAVRIVRENGLKSLVITCSSDGILAITPHGHFLTRGPTLEEVNAAGAGDATSAALMWRLSLGDDWSTSLRWAAATGAATVLTEATAESKFDMVQELLPRVEQERLAP